MLNGIMLNSGRVLFSMLLCLLMEGVLAAGETPPASPPPDAATVQKWIAELDSENYEQREQATQSLEKAGPDAARALGVAVAGDRLEITARGIRILQSMFLAGDDAASAAAEAVLDQLAKSPIRSVARRASVSLNSDGIRQQRALVKISELGGSSDVMASMHNHAGNPLVSKVTLLRNWKGGDAGLVHVRKFPELRELWVVMGAGVSSEALEKLQRDVPNLLIVHRGPAKLGVAGQPVEKGLLVVTVAPDSSARDAGIEEGDIMTKYNGKLINDFDSLVELTSKTQPGDEVLVEVLRGEEKLAKAPTPLTIKVKMGEWK